MDIPVLNWRDRIDDTDVFGDFVDKSKKHYSPRPVFGKLEKQEYEHSVIMTSTLEFGYSTSEISYLAQQSGASKLVPLVAIDVENTLKMKEKLKLPHSYEISTIPTHPFPKLFIQIKIDKSDTDYEKVVSKIEKSAESTSLLKGNYTFKYSMKNVNFACDYKQAYKRAAKEIHSSIGAKLISKREAFDITSRFIKNEIDELISPINSTLTSKLKKDLKDFATLQYFRAIFKEDTAVLKFDSADELPGYKLRDPRTIINNQVSMLSQSKPIELELAMF